MKRQTTMIVTVALVMLLGLSLTGFQCGSAESTSAKLYIQRSDWAKAEELLAKEVEKNPNNAEAWYLLGDVRLRQNNYRGMMDAFDHSLKVSNEFQGKIAETKRFAWAQAVNDGVTMYNKSVKAPPDSAAEFLKQAIDHYGVAIMISPDSVVGYQNMSVAQYAAGNYDEQIRYLKQAVQRKPTLDLQVHLANAYLNKAQTAEAKGNTQDAQANYSEALAILGEAQKANPDDEEVMRTMIDLYIKTGRSNEAKPMMRQALEDDPTNKIYQYNLGVLLLQSDSLEAAIHYFEEALKLDPMYEFALQNIGVAHLKLGDEMRKASDSPKGSAGNRAFIDHFKKAAQYFEQLVKLKGDNADYWDFLASAYANAGMVKQAEEAIRKADALRKK
jgi:tetratricopeptide (TPR) repeat protein